MKKFISNKYLVLSFRIVLGLIFIISGVEKIGNAEEFAQSIENFRMLPIFSINIIALFLPWLELICGLMLLFGVAVKENSFLITGMLILFTLGIFQAVFRNLDIDCGCFGTLHVQKVGLLKILENTGQIILGLTVIFFHPKHFYSLNILSKQQNEF